MTNIGRTLPLLVTDGQCLTEWLLTAKGTEVEGQVLLNDKDPVLHVANGSKTSSYRSTIGVETGSWQFAEAGSGPSPLVLKAGPDKYNTKLECLR